jgi:MFS family permease
MTSFWGRAPVLFWTTLIGTLFGIGSTLSKDFQTFYAMRALTGWFITAAQTISICFIKDMFFFHERARKIGLWASLYIASPYIGPCFSSFVVAGTQNWRNVFWLCVGVCALQLCFILLFIDETWYNRSIPRNGQIRRGGGLGGRMMRILGVWQLRHHNFYYYTIWRSFARFASTLAKPVMLLVLAN